MASGLLFSSCDDFLDVRPDSQKLEADLFAKAKGYEDAIYGVYGYMQSEALYGKELLWGLTDIMAQDLNQTTTSSTALARYEYSTDDELRTRFASVWNTAYTSIGYANNVLKNLEGASEDNLPLYKLYKGEMLAVRAMLHFDLLRLFCSTNESAQGIPYAKTYSQTINDFKKVGEVYDLILADLSEAEKLMEGEADGITYPRNNSNYYKFQNFRETHCNYYGVLALMARVYWMRGNMEKAGEYAGKVIDSQKFPLAEPNEVKDLYGGRLSPKETIWGLYSVSYNETCNSYLYNYRSFSSYDPYYDGSGTNHLLPFDQVYKQDVDATAQDFRMNWFRLGTGYARCLKTVDVYALEDNAVAPAGWNERIQGISLLHVSEMYLIAAEALLKSDYSRALRYFNAETASRGLTPLRDDVTLTKDMIYNEYHKEMFGEGQMWYNMKRLNRDIISNLDTKTIPASEDIYVIPIPQDEYNYRK